ncbi:MAG: glyoxalase, partial [Bacteroidaceae bacterium]|nr:glyoxalase [Bacteroidaceae bacterium]
GAKSVLPPTTEPWGQRTCYVADPDGNLIEIGSFNE